MRPEDLGIGKLFERVRDAIIVADAETQRVVLWNPAATNIFGYTLSEALELRVEALVPEHLKALHRAGMIRYSETGHREYIDSQRLLDLSALKKGGEEIRIELSLNPISPVGDGGGRFVLAIIRDVTQRKRAEERLAEERNLLRTLIDNLPDFIFVKDTESRFVINNKEHLRVLGATEQSEVLGKTDFDLFPGELAEGYYADEREVMRTGQPLIGREEPVVDGAGNRRWLLTTKVPLRDSCGVVAGLVGMSRDITERKRAEEEIRHLNETLEQRVEERTAQLAERESRLRDLLGKLVVAQEEERRQVAYEVHDGLAQMIVAVQQHLQAFAKDFLASGNNTFLLAEEGGRPVGFLEATGGAFRRNRHVAHLVIGVLEEHAGRGIGTALIVEAERWAQERGLRRLELTVQTHNRAARALYESMGFAVEGERKDAMLVEGSYVDEYYMARLLD